MGDLVVSFSNEFKERVFDFQGVLYSDKIFELFDKAKEFRNLIVDKHACFAFEDWYRELLKCDILENKLLDQKCYTIRERALRIAEALSDVVLLLDQFYFVCDEAHFYYDVGKKGGSLETSS